LSAILSFTLSSGVIFAANHVNYFGGKLIGGVGDSGRDTQHYWLSSSATGQSSLISSAMSSWNGTATPIYFSKTTNNAQSVMDFYYGNYFPSGDNTIAQTKWYKYSSVRVEERNRIT
jgi:hypothetical protein